MSLEVPNLDDRTFTDLVEEALAMIPRYAPKWTNHNPSDPGITLIELLAYFTEMLIYRLNRVSQENKIQFLRLLHGPEWNGWEYLAKASLKEVEAEIKTTVLALRQPQRAITSEDFEYLARQATLADSAAMKVVRVHCAARRNLETNAAWWESDRPGHVSVIIVPNNLLNPEDFEPLLEKVRQYLAPKCLLTTRLHVVPPCYLWVSLGIVIHPQVGASFKEVRKRAIAELQRYFSPLPDGGPDAAGWPFGRNIYLSEIFQVLERVAGVDYIEKVQVLQLATSEEPLHENRMAVGIQIGIHSTVGVDSRLGTESSSGKERLLRDSSGKLIAIALRSYELVRIVVREEDIRLNTPSGPAPIS
jgi:hypothetical protein